MAERMAPVDAPDSPEAARGDFMIFLASLAAGSCNEGRNIHFRWRHNVKASAAIASLLLLLCAAFVRADAPPAGASEYLDGLGALEHAQFGDAVTSMGKAIDADEENPDYRIGRAVALIFSEKPHDAEADLQRAMKLRPADSSAKMWLATAVAMQGDFGRDSNIYPFATYGATFDNAVREMSHDYGQYGWEIAENRRTGGGQVGAQTRAKFANAKAQFPILAKEFAGDAESSLQANNSGLAAVVRDRALARVQQKDYAGALTDLTRLMSSAPDDPQLMGAHAACLLALGCPFLARAESTRVLTHDINNADAYATRAVAAAKMGDSRRADADLKIIAEIDPSKLQDDQAAVSAAAAETPAGFAPAELVGRVEELHQMAADQKPWDALVAQAVSINKGENSVRRRFDEDYQDGLRVLTLATQKQPSNAEALAQLGEFLFHGAVNVPGEAVEPRATFRTFRLLNEQGRAAEIARASQILDSALNIDPKNMRAVAAKVELLIHGEQWGDAETMLRQALAINPNEPKLLDLFTRVMDFAASVRMANANQLRTPKTWEDAVFIYTRYPSQSELAAADEYDQQANQLWAIGSDSLRAAAKAMAGTADGFNYASVVASRDGNLDEAISDLEQAVKLAPGNAEFHDTLADFYDQKQMRDPAADQRAISVNLMHTTAGPMLRLAWLQIPMTQFKSAKASLNRAIALDPADARSAAYLGMIAADDSKLDEALPWMVAAAALDEAEGRFEGRSATSTAIGQIPPSRVGLGIAIDIKAAGFCLKQKQPQPAAEILDVAIAAGSRVPGASIYAPTPSSMLPDSTNSDPGVVVPSAHSVATMMAWAHLYRGRALSAQSKPDEAIAEFKAVLGYMNNVPPTVDAGTAIRLPVAYAAYALGLNAMKHNNPQAALAFLNGHGPPQNASDQQFWQNYNKLFEQARLAMQNNPPQNNSPQNAPPQNTNPQNRGGTYYPPRY